MKKVNHETEEFWQGLLDYIQNGRGPIATFIPDAMVPDGRNYVEIPLKWRGFRLCASADSTAPNRKVELLITGKASEDYAKRLTAQLSEVEAEVGCGLEWNIGLSGKKKISLWDRGVNVFAGLRSDHYAWYTDKLELLHRVFEPRIRQLTAS